jgi:hypothetical protein
VGSLTSHNPTRLQGLLRDSFTLLNILISSLLFEGENLKDRSIIATTSGVECLLCPYHWLVKNSEANVWQKIKHFLETYLPTKEQLFKEFLNQRRWLDYQEKLVKDILRKSNIQSNTTIHDVPYSIRIKESVKLYNL